MDKLPKSSRDFGYDLSLDNGGYPNLRRRKRLSETHKRPANKKLKSISPTYGRCRDNEGHARCFANETSPALEEQGEDCLDSKWEVIDSWEAESLTEDESFQGPSRWFELQKEMPHSNGLSQKPGYGTQKCASSLFVLDSEKTVDLRCKVEPLDGHSEPTGLCSEGNQPSDLLCAGNGHRQGIISGNSLHTSGSLSPGNARIKRVKLKKMKLVLSKVDRRHYEPFLRVKIARSLVEIPSSVVDVRKVSRHFLPVRIPKSLVRVPSALVGVQKKCSSKSSLVDNLCEQEADCSFTDAPVSAAGEQCTKTNQCYRELSALKSETGGWSSAGENPFQP